MCMHIYIYIYIGGGSSKIVYNNRGGGGGGHPKQKLNIGWVIIAIICFLKMYPAPLIVNDPYIPNYISYIIQVVFCSRQY